MKHDIKKHQSLRELLLVTKYKNDILLSTFFRETRLLFFMHPFAYFIILVFIVKTASHADSNESQHLSLM